MRWGFGLELDFTREGLAKALQTAFSHRVEPFLNLLVHAHPDFAQQEPSLAGANQFPTPTKGSEDHKVAGT